jgi:MFS family permease
MVLAVSTDTSRYVLFSIGNLTPLFDSVWKSCWSSYETCDKQWVYAVTYLEILGIIVGQVLVGVLGDWLGRRWGLIQDALIMFGGLLMLTASWGVTGESSTCRSSISDVVLMWNRKRLGYLLCLFLVLLRNWGWWRVSYDCHCCHGERYGCWSRVNQRGSSSPWTKGHYCVLNAGQYNEVHTISS